VWPSLGTVWQKITGQFEGAGLSYMYTDALGLVTTGYGNLVDPESAAAALPWVVNATGALATPAEVQTEWTTVKNGGATYRSTNAASHTSLHLTADTIQTLFNSVSAANEAAIRKIIPAYDNLPADAQLALMSMVWAMGSGGLASFKTLVSAVNASPPDFTTAAAQSHMQGTGIDARNAMDKLAFQNAATVIANKLDPSALYWPGTPGNSSPGISDAVAAAQTVLTPINIALFAGMGLFIYGLHTGKLRRGLRKAGVYVPTSWRRKIRTPKVPALLAPA
jgi:GH24 family phage-related lysozyme (muramidase)